MVVACAAAIWLIGRPADFTGLGKGVSDGISTDAEHRLREPAEPWPVQLPAGHGHDPQISQASFSYTSGRTVVDQNANELWTVLVCKPWLDGEFGTTAFTASGKADAGHRLRPAAAVGAGDRGQREADDGADQGQAGRLRGDRADHSDARIQSSTRCSRARNGRPGSRSRSPLCSPPLVAGVLVLLISVTLILLKLGFLLLLIVGPFFLLIGTHPGFGRVVAVRWFEMLVGVLLKQAAVALALSVLLYCYALIMGTADAVLPWALKILMITLVTVAVFIYRKPFQHLFAAVGYGAIGATDRAEADLGRAAATARANTRDAATLGVPGFAAYRAARWARRNPAQAAGLALGAAAAASTASVAAGAAAGAEGAGDGRAQGTAVPAGVAAGSGGAGDPAAAAQATVPRAGRGPGARPRERRRRARRRRCGSRHSGARQPAGRTAARRAPASPAARPSRQPRAGHAERRVRPASAATVQPRRRAAAGQVGGRGSGQPARPSERRAGGAPVWQAARQARLGRFWRGSPGGSGQRPSVPARHPVASPSRSCPGGAARSRTRGGAPPTASRRASGPSSGRRRSRSELRPRAEAGRGRPAAAGTEPAGRRLAVIGPARAGSSGQALPGRGGVRLAAAPRGPAAGTPGRGRPRRGGSGGPADSGGALRTAQPAVR